MKIKIVTLFPEMFQGFINESIVKRAIDKGNVEIECVDFRKYSHDKHHHVDDTPYGGGAGMVLRCDILDECIEDIKTPKSHIALMSPQGVQYDQAMANRLAKEEELILVCGHYEGFDERVRGYVDEEISMGDFVLTGGEIPAMAISDSVTRLLDGSIREESYEDDSFYNGLLEYPQYTRPQVYKGVEVPFVLQNGDHAKIKTWRLKESLRKTYLRRPDLLKNRTLTKEEAKLLAEVKDELNNN
jgi:tRNA (guanine37-N1)-methyltransferase